jgi:hypothetical protein
MRRLLASIVLALSALVSSGQTTTVATTATTGAGVVVPRATLSFQLQNCGVTVTPNPTATLTANAFGVVNATVPNSNSFVCPSNQAYYLVTMKNFTGNIVWTRPYQLTGGTNTLATPLAALPSTATDIRTLLGPDGKILSGFLPAGAPTVQSVNGHVGTVVLAATDVGAVPSTGGSVTGPIALPADPTLALQAATKQYVDNSICKLPALVQYAPSAWQVAGSVTSTFSASLVAGNTIYVVGASEGTTGSSVTSITGISDTQGNVFHPIFVQSGSVFDVGEEIWYATNIVGGPESITVSATGATPEIRVEAAEYRGVATSSALDNSVLGWSASSPIYPGPLTTAGPNELLLVTLVNVASASSPGFTQSSPSTTFSNSGTDNLTFSMMVAGGGLQNPGFTVVSGGAGNVHTVSTAFFPTPGCISGGSSPQPVPLYNSTGTLQASAHTVTGIGTLVGGALTVTFTGSSVFTSSTSYACSQSDTTAVHGFEVTYTSGSVVTFTGTGTDTFRYSCVGN